MSPKVKLSAREKATNLLNEAPKRVDDAVCAAFRESDAEVERLKAALVGPERQWNRLEEVLQQNLDRSHGRVEMFDLADILRARRAALDSSTPAPRMFTEEQVRAVLVRVFNGDHPVLPTEEDTAAAIVKALLEAK